VDELHLFENGRLSGFTGTEKKHLDLVSLHHLIPLELVLNLLVPGLALLLLCAHSATHCDCSVAVASTMLNKCLNDEMKRDETTRCLRWSSGSRWSGWDGRCQ
jgi:hypothetical protein